jgi:hypothetical protein
MLQRGQHGWRVLLELSQEEELGIAHARLDPDRSRPSLFQAQTPPASSIRPPLTPKHMEQPPGAEEDDQKESLRIARMLADEAVPPSLQSCLTALASLARRQPTEGGGLRQAVIEELVERTYLQVSWPCMSACCMLCIPLAIHATHTLCMLGHAGSGAERIWEAP